MTLKPQEGSFGSAKGTVASPVRLVPSTRQVQACQRAELQGEHSSGIAVSGQRHGAYEKNVLNLVLGHLSTVAWLSLDTFCSRRLPYCGQPGGFKIRTGRMTPAKASCRLANQSRTGLGGGHQKGQTGDTHN